MWEKDCWAACMSEVPHWIIIIRRRMSSYYNIIEHIHIRLRPFKLKCVFIYFINYSRKLSEIFISLTHSIKVVRKMEWLECQLWGSLNHLLKEDITCTLRALALVGVNTPQLLFYIQNFKNAALSGYGFLKIFRTYKQLVLIYRTNCSVGCKKTWFLIEKGGERRKKWIEKREKHDFFLILFDVVVYIILMSCINRNWDVG